jgi:hypothetical protein
MLIEKDLSEMNDTERAKLVDQYFTDYAQTVAFTAKELQKKGDSITKELARQLMGKEEEILRLRSWVSAVLAEYVVRKQSELLSRSSIMSQSPPESIAHLVQTAKTAFTKLRDRVRTPDKPKLDRLTDSILGLIETFELIWNGVGLDESVRTGEALGDGKQTR